MEIRKPGRSLCCASVFLSRYRHASSPLAEVPNGHRDFRLQADIEATLTPANGPTLLNISMIHPRYLTNVAAASKRGAPLLLCVTGASTECMQAICLGHTCVPASAATTWHLGKPIMRYVRTMSDIASACSLAVTRGSLLASAHRQLSVALVQSQGWV
jgi:hypothetical protein